MNSVLENAKKLNKKYQNDSFALFADAVPTYQRLSVGDLGMDFPLFGGIPYGRMITVSGKEHSGKTLAVCTILASYQRANPDKTCVFVDVEHALDKVFISQMTGLDLKKLLYINPEAMSGEQILDAVVSIQDSDDIGAIAVDSIAALQSGREMETDVEKDNGRAASMAKPLAKFIKQMLPLLSSKNNLLILINQVRQVGTTFTGAAIYDEPGGHAPKYYASVKIRFGTRTFTQGDKVDCSDGEKADGLRLKFAITKNKTASVARGGGFLTYRYATGLDWLFDTFEVALKYEFIQRPTAQSYQLVDLTTGEVYKNPETGEPLRLVGKGKVKEFLNSHIDFQVEYLKMLNKYISTTGKSYGSLLDERDLIEIRKQEESVEAESKKRGESLGESDGQESSNS